ncbi:MAG TPA: chitosanase [Tepidisphaeraceae bacterium]|nr:chitosanase [Tepidisphaeraceae bacterium]
MKRSTIMFPVMLALLLAAGPTTAPSSSVKPGLTAPAKKEIAMQLVSAAENSSLDWRAQYAYIEYNVEHNARENRGYTAGIIGFTSRTHDMLEVVRLYDTISPKNVLSKYLPALEKVDDTPATTGLGKDFERDWKMAGADPKFREAQDRERDRTYFDPTVSQAQADGLHELGQFAYYDCAVMHGSCEHVRAAAMKKAKTPAQGGDEVAYLNAFLDARVREMKREEAHGDVSRVETAQRVFLREGNLSLDPPLRFKTYGDEYTIPGR